MIKRKDIVNIVAFCLGLFFVLATPGNLFAQPSPSTPLKENVSQQEAIRFQPPAQHAPSDAVGGCPRCQSDIVTLLVPTDNFDADCAPRFSLTVQEHPTLYIYIRKLAALQEIIADDLPNFVLYDNRSRTTLYEANFSLPTESGVVPIELPSTVTLEVGKAYTWGIEVEEKLGSMSSIEGWIERIEVPSQLNRQLAATTNPIDRARLYANAGIWYDALDTLVQARQTSDSQELKTQWQSLLASIDVNDVANVSIVAVDVDEKGTGRNTIPAAARSVKCL